MSLSVGGNSAFVVEDKLSVTEDPATEVASKELIEETAGIIDEKVSGSVVVFSSTVLENSIDVSERVSGRDEVSFEVVALVPEPRSLLTSPRFVDVAMKVTKSEVFVDEWGISDEPISEFVLIPVVELGTMSRH